MLAQEKTVMKKARQMPQKTAGFRFIVTFYILETNITSSQLGDKKSFHGILFRNFLFPFVP
jgi:hypothetical protein